MPARDRGSSAAAAADVELSRWAAAQGLDASPARIAAWRMRGLVVSPTGVRPRPDGAPPGRLARDYTPAELELAQTSIAFLARTARRGMPHTELAVRAFAAGLLVAHEAVVEGLRAQLDGVAAELAVARALVASEVAAVPPGWRLSDEYDTAEALARRAINKRTPLARSARRMLRKAGCPAGKEDVHQMLTALLATMLGQPPDRTDNDAAAMLLSAFGGTGLVEPIEPGLGPVVEEGPVGLTDALALAVEFGLWDVPDDLTADELIAARASAQLMSAALAAIPNERLRYHVAADALGNLWRPEDPALVALTLVHLVKLARSDLLDLAPLVDAVREQGWLRVDG